MISNQEDLSGIRAKAGEEQEGLRCGRQVISYHPIAF